MKKMILSIAALAMIGLSPQTASAGGRHGGGWCAAAVVGGFTAGLVVSQALAPQPAYYVAPPPVYYPAPPLRPVVVYAAPAPVVYAAPAPVVVYPAPVCVARPVVSVSFGCGGHRRGCR